MKRPLIVTLLLTAFACTSSEPAQRGPWTIGDLSDKLLDRYADGGEEGEESEEPRLNAMPDAAFAGPAAPTTPGGPPEAEDSNYEETAGEDGLSDAKEEESEEAPLFGGQAEESPSADSPAARPRTWRRSQLVPNTSKLSVGTDEELPLERTEITVRVDGFRARVFLNLFYRNNTEQRLQGTLKLRLPEGATPTATAFGALPPVLEESPPASDDVYLKRARFVPRTKAAHAYEETVRKKIDPALVEWAGAGIYSVKVFPLEPGQLHHVSIDYDVTLTAVGDALEYRLDLPEKSGKAKVEFLVNAQQHSVNDEASSDGSRYRFENARGSYLVRVANPGAMAITGSNPATGPLYAMRFSPELPSARSSTAPSAIFMLDTSLSSNPTRMNIWLDLMERILQRNRASIREFRVGMFNIGVHWWKDEAVANTSENVARAVAFAKTLALEGATDLGNPMDACAAVPGTHDLFLLSDGAATWGERDKNALEARVPERCTIFAYRTGLLGTDAAALQRLARASGGAMFSVVGADALDAAADAHTQRPWTIQSVSGPGSDLLLQGRPTTLYPGQSLIATGRGTLDGPITLVLRQGDRLLEVTGVADETTASPLMAGLYGSIAVEQLEEFGEATEAVAKAYALHFGVVGKSCSLVMLESEEDYAEYGISPADERDFVNTQEASTTVDDALRNRAKDRNDARARLAAFLRKLESAPGMDFEPNEHLLAALAAVRFDDAPAVREARPTPWSEIPGSIQEQLASLQLDYDDIVDEATRRRESDGLRALSSLVEQDPGDLDVARDVGYTALAWGRGADAYELFRGVAEKRPHQPAIYVAMAQSLERSGNVALAKLWYEVALAGEWNERFGSFREVATVHYLSFLRRHKDDRLETLVPTVETPEADLVVSVFWNTDRSDVDLYVRDANGETCSYNHKTTKMGGRITRDVTEGCGPEMFLLEKAVPGEYAAWVNYFAEDDTQLSTRTRIFVTIIENWGRAGEREHTRVVQLATNKEDHAIALLTRNAQ